MRRAKEAGGLSALVRGCEFRENKPQIELGEAVRRAAISGNILTGPHHQPQQRQCPDQRQRQRRVKDAG